MKKLIAFLIAWPIVWAILIGLIGIAFMKMVASLSIDGTPMFIQTEEQALTVIRWMLGVTGLMAAGFGVEIARLLLIGIVRFSGCSRRADDGGIEERVSYRSLL